MRNKIMLLLMLVFSGITLAQEKILLYPNGPAESNGIVEAESNLRPDFVINITEPRMYAYPAAAENNSGTAVLICPGGGYSGVSVIKEGSEIAKWFNALGVSAFVLYYRMPNGNHTIPLKDAQTALEIIHQRAKAWKINTRKIGVMGFSAGGHLAASVGTLYDSKIHRPAFMILGYPVITMKQELTHGGSRKNLLGTTPTDELVFKYSTELQINKKTPPAFIIHANDDKTVPVKQSVIFADAMKANKVPVELHLFAAGGHGFGMRKTNPEVDTWPQLLEKWLAARKLIQ